MTTLSGHGGSCLQSKHFGSKGGRTAWAQEFKTSLSNIVRLCIKIYIYRTARWLMPVIPALGGPRWVDREVKKSRPSWSTWWNPVSTKNTKISRAWWHAPVVPATREAGGGRIAWTQEVEVAVSRDRTITLQPRWQERDSVSNTKTKTKNCTTAKMMLYVCRNYLNASFLSLLGNSEMTS